MCRTMPSSFQIYVHAEAENSAWMDLAPIIECLLPVKFNFLGQRSALIAGEIIHDLDAAGLPSIAAHKSVSILKVPLSKKMALDSDLADITVKFSDDSDVPFPFRGRLLHVKIAEAPEILSPSSDEKILASCDAGPIWTSTTTGGLKCFRSAFAIPAIPNDGTLHDVFHPGRFFEMLPLFHFIHEVCKSSLYEGPPLRACFIFDDPNLHWPRYGFVDFQQIATHATKENYHVSFATIPLDAWFVHSGTAGLFRKNTGRLSLAAHGNNHTHWELARDVPNSTRTSLLNQAVHRIECLDRKAGLSVSRVMVPPHGACSEAMLKELPRCGFEAACISHGSLGFHNKGRFWTKRLGYATSELIEGCSVLPRWGMVGNTTNTILLAAFLRQPIILRGHHQDLKGGVELLDDLARFINSLGSVLWLNMAEMSRINYMQRREGNTLRVKPLAKKVNIQISKTITQLVIENPELQSWDEWRILGMSGTELNVKVGDLIAVSDRLNHVISLEAICESSVSSKNNSTCPAVWAFLRRLLTEGRDRICSVKCLAT
jgi:hypothetical protein